MFVSNLNLYLGSKSALCGNQGNLSPASKSSLQSFDERDLLSPFAHFGKSPFHPFLSGLRLPPSSIGCGIALPQGANRKATPFSQIPGQSSRHLFSNLNPMSPFSPFASVYGTPQASNGVLGFSPYNNNPNFGHGGPNSEAIKAGAASAFSKNSAFSSILRGLGSVAYNGRFSYNSQPFNALTSAKLDPPSTSNEK